MTFEQATSLLSTLRREELRDHAFGDREIYWRVVGSSEDSPERAFAYSGGGSTPSVSIYDENDPTVEIASFSRREALALMECGAEAKIERNDSTGPSEYREGVCLPGLTLEGVRKELTGQK